MFARARILFCLTTWLTSAAAFAGGDPVFTIFLHGTGGHRSGRDYELITEFGAAYWGREATQDDGMRGGANAFYTKHYQKSFLILDGVGTCDMYTSPTGPEQVGLATTTRPVHPMPGDFIPDALEKKLKPEKERVSNMMVLTLFKVGMKKHRGDIFGDGWDDNVAHALFVLADLYERDRKNFPKTINMIGWSRGAVTSIKLANAIQDWFIDGKPYMMPRDYRDGYAAPNMVEFYKARPAAKRVKAGDLKLNLFLIDPVPGRFGLWGDANDSKRSRETFPAAEMDYQKLPPSVANCIITLANDEQREGFAPLDADDIQIMDKKKTTAVWLPFPGIHRTQLRMEPRDPLDDYNEPAVRHKLTAVPHIVWDMAWRFLNGHGTKFERDLLTHPKFAPPSAIKQPGRALTASEIVDLYANSWLLREAYHQTRNRGVLTTARFQGGLEPRLYTGYPFRGIIIKERTRQKLFTAELGVYVESPGFFVNEHHRACFRLAHPNLFAYLTGTKPATSVKVGGKKAYAVPAAVAKELSAMPGYSETLGQLMNLGLFEEKKSFYVLDTFRFKEQLGEPLFNEKDRLPRKMFPRFTDKLGGTMVLPG